MAETQDLLEHDDLWGRLRRDGVPTGLADLDALTWGLAPGALWVVAGDPGAGKTMFLAQLARVAALAGASTRFISGREDRQLVVAYWLAAQARVPLHHLLGAQLSEDELQRLQAARQRLQAAPLEVWTEADAEWVDAVCHSTPSFSWLVEGTSQRARVMTVDDVDVLLGAPLHERIRAMRDWTRRACFTLVVSVPTAGVWHQGQLDPVIGREADVVLVVQPEPLEAAAQAGHQELSVLRNRYGPVARIPLQFQGFYAKYVSS